MSAVAAFAVRLGRLAGEAVCAVFHDIRITVRTLCVGWALTLAVISLLTAVYPELAAAPADSSCQVTEPDYRRLPHPTPESITELMALARAAAAVRP